MKVNINKVRSFIELQDKANRQIEKKGECTEEVAADLERVGSSLNVEEIDLVCKIISRLRSSKQYETN